MGKKQNNNYERVIINDKSTVMQLMILTYRPFRKMNNAHKTKWINDLFDSERFYIIVCTMCQKLPALVYKMTTDGARYLLWQ